MNRKRPLVAAGALAGLAGLGMLVVTHLPEPSGVTYANFQRVQVGMSQAEVEAIFDGPPRDTAPNGRTCWGLLLL